MQIGNYVSGSELKRRGWTEKMIDVLLGKPDSTQANPYYRHAAQMNLYRIERVKYTESTPGFFIAKENAEKRKMSSCRAIETKREGARNWARSVFIQVPSLDREETVRNAIKTYNESHFSQASNDSDWRTLREITLTYIRHKMTDYESLLEIMHGTIGVDSASDIIQERVQAKIIEVNPWLGVEE
jgi:hypothetical protein